MLSVVREPISLLASHVTLPRHGHAGAYATLVLEGGYEEAGEEGRWRVEPGAVLLHAPFSIHCDRSWHSGARLVNLPLPLTTSVSGGGVSADADIVLRLARHDPVSAAEALLASWRPGLPPFGEAEDRLAGALTTGCATRIETWSAAEGVTRQTTFRRFRQLYGVGPARYRVEARARRAWRLIMAGAANLAEIALEAGYADQAHMSRDVRALTRRTPSAWVHLARSRHPFKREAARS